MLSEDERSMLNSCAVFAGGFDLVAAVRVVGAGELDEFVVLDLLSALVRKSLVNAERFDGRTRLACARLRFRRGPHADFPTNTRAAHTCGRSGGFKSEWLTTHPE